MKRENYKLFLPVAVESICLIHDKLKYSQFQGWDQVSYVSMTLPQGKTKMDKKTGPHLSKKEPKNS